MRITAIQGSAALYVALTCGRCLPLQSAELHYRFIRQISIGGEGGWDYLSVDPAAHRLYVTHADEVDVIDLQTDRLIGKVTNTPGVHGFAVAPALGLGFASNGRQNRVSIVDLASLHTRSSVETGANPDAILFEPDRNEVYAFNGRGESATVFAAASGKVLATIPLGGKPEFAQADPVAGRVFNNLEDRSQVVAIDTRTHQVVARWSISPGEEASGMAIDLAHHRLFLGCANRKMVMMDSRNGKVLAEVPIGAGVDANAFDPGTQLAFASCGDGTVTIAHEDSPEALTVVQSLATERGARTMALDESTHRIYLATAKVEPAAANGASGAQGRPRFVPGSFHVLVYGPER